MTNIEFPPAVIWDLDSTLADTRHRRHLVPAEQDKATPEAWVPYYEACVDDSPINGNAVLFRTLRELGAFNFIVTGRLQTRKVSEATEMWLKLNQLWPTELLLTPKNWNPVRDGDWKIHALKIIRARGFKPTLAIDDWHGSCRAFESAGLPTIQAFPPGLGEQIKSLKATASAAAS